MTTLKIFQQYPALFNQLIEIQPLFQQILDMTGLNRLDLQIDHIALRVNDVDMAKQWQACFAEEATLLSNNEINGRPIYLYELEKPLLILEQEVRVVELPFPKAKNYPQQGWEHIEMVLPFIVNETVEQWFARVEKLLAPVAERIILQKSCHKGDGEGLPNPAVAIKLADKSNFATIKLHPYAIKQIVMSE
ncbi:VOC family protein [Gallibacterium trehalosifermentans]|uniref:VOC family protein n=1 Tax=Gallibacterium trehalosifermentans TaxID=516935 RepID=A0ABV6H206_9PAST